MHRLTESERGLISLSLRIAIERYNDDAQIAIRERKPGIAQQFSRQSDEAERLAQMIEGSDHVEVRY
jgi:hypothetical protein